MKIQQNKTTLV